MENFKLTVHSVQDRDWFIAKMQECDFDDRTKRIVCNMLRQLPYTRGDVRWMDFYFKVRKLETALKEYDNLLTFDA